MSAAHGARDLASLLQAHAAATPQARALVFLERGEREAGTLDYAALDLRARAIGAALQARGCQGERVLLPLPNGPDYVAALFGCFYAGAIAVPAPEPESRRGAERTVAICRDCAPKLALTVPALRRRAPAWEECKQASGLAELAIGDIPDGAARDWRDPGLASDALAVLQYTSGSTSSPKGVMLTHAALLANLAMFASALRIDADSRMVSWLPIYHDMGLVAALLTPLFAGGLVVLMSPLAFLQDPLRWTHAISRYRGTISGGPSFAFAMCMQAAERRGAGDVDLSSWRVAYCGAEPVRAANLERFATTFAPYGFRRHALLPAYGLAEATVFVSAEACEAGVLSVARPGGGPDVVSCGRPAEGLEVVVAEPETLAPLPEGRIGEFFIRGPSVGAGYWQRPAESAATFGCRIAGRGDRPFLRTGDLGFLSEGRLAITGRAKDLIIVRGENHHPEDIEASVADAHPALSAGKGAAISVEGEAGEALVVVFEAARSDAALAGEISRAVAAAIAQSHGLALLELALIRPLSLPRTANGKIQRRRCRELYLAGDLARVA